MTVGVGSDVLFITLVRRGGVESQHCVHPGIT